MPIQPPNNGVPEALSDALPERTNQQRIDERNAGADRVFASMVEKAKTDPEMAELLQGETAEKFQESVEHSVEAKVLHADERLHSYAQQMATTERARLTLHTDGRIEVEGPVSKIAELLEAAKERQNR